MTFSVTEIFYMILNEEMSKAIEKREMHIKIRGKAYQKNS
jgi:hypothetical protein